MIRALHVSPDGTPLHNGVEAVDAAMLASLKAAGRVKFIDGDDQEIFPGIRAYTGGKNNVCVVAVIRDVPDAVWHGPPRI